LTGRDPYAPPESEVRDRERPPEPDGFERAAGGLALPKLSMPEIG
jgi:hypothetical protein